MPKDPQKDGQFRYGWSKYLAAETRTWGYEPNDGLPITPEGEFPFDAGEPEVPREIPFPEPKAHPLLRKK